MQPVLILRAAYLASYVFALEKLGVDPAPLLARHHLPDESGRLGKFMVSARDVYEFVEEATTLAPPGALSTIAGLHNAGRQPNPFREGTTHAVNLLDAIHRHNALVPRYGPGSRFKVRISGNEVCWLKATRSPLAETEIFCVASLIGHVRGYTDARWLPTSVAVGVASPEALKYQQELPGLTVLRSKDNGTHVHFQVSEVWQKPTNAQDSTERLRSSSADEPDFIESLRLLMQGYARTGRLSLEETARAARMSIRTLQRRLQQAGISHATLADQARFEVARDLLATASELSITEIAFELGYSDPGSFSRAFRRFAGVPPQDYRRRQMLAPGRSVA